MEFAALNQHHKSKLIERFEYFKDAEVVEENISKLLELLKRKGLKGNCSTVIKPDRFNNGKYRLKII